MEQAGRFPEEGGHLPGQKTAESEYKGENSNRQAEKSAI